MIEAIALGISLILGTVAGLVHWGGLHVTVKKLPTSGHPILVLLGSFALRTAIALTCFYFVVTLFGWQWLAPGLLTFLSIRSVAIRWALTTPGAEVTETGRP